MMQQVASIPNQFYQHHFISSAIRLSNNCLIKRAAMVTTTSSGGGAFTTLKERVTFEKEIKKSKFIAIAAPISDERSAFSFLSEVRDPRATHNCWAYKMTQNSVFATTYKVMKMFQRVRRQVETGSLRDELNTKLVKPLGTMFKSSHRIEMDKLDYDMRSEIDKLLEVANRRKSGTLDDATRSEINKICEISIRIKSSMQQGNVLETGDIKSERDRLVTVINIMKSIRKYMESKINTQVNNQKVDE